VLSDTSLASESLYQQHRWLINVFSKNNFTHAGSRLGTQLHVHVEGAWVAKRLGRGWVAPHFIALPIDSRVAEEMTDNGTISKLRVADGHPYIITTLPVSCEQLFACRAEDFAQYNPAFLTLEQLERHSGATIDHLLVQGAGIIGGQACANAHCSRMDCSVRAQVR